MPLRIVIPLPHIDPGNTDDIKLKPSPGTIAFNVVWLLYSE